MPEPAYRPSWLDKPSLVDAQQTRRAKSKAAIPTRFEEKDAALKDDDKKLEVWRSAVFRLDSHACRHCGVKVLRTLDNVSKRAEANHLEGRAFLPLRYDVRNGITLCQKCHRRVTGMVNDKFKIVGTVFFRVAGRRFINAREPVKFVPATARKSA